MNRIKSGLRAFCCFFCVSPLLTACSSIDGDDSADRSVYAPQDLEGKIGGYQVVTADDQINKTLSAYPTLFRLSIAEGKDSFDRMLFFFENYTSGYTPKTVKPNQKDLTLVSSNSNQGAAYKVRRTFQGDEVVYAVSAALKANPARSKLMAANLARFTREGQLEMSLITSQR